jgi:PAS domain S-box-containing protein
MTRPLANPDLSQVTNATSPAIGPKSLPRSSEARVPVTVLMVDDEPSKLLSYEVILKNLDENLVKAHSGREALEYLLKSDVAVVLMDVSMPEIDGFELADLMRQHPRFQETPIIFVSAIHQSDMDRIRGYQSGAVDYISVPVVPDVLRAKVSVFADLYRKTRQLQDLNRELEARVAERSEELRVLNGQLQERVAELESIMRVLPVGVAVAHDPDCNVITGNAALSKVLGMEAGDNLSKSAGADYEVYRDGKPILNEELPVQIAAHTKRPTGMSELEIRCSGNAPTFLLASAFPLFNEGGDVRGAVGAFFDVTERKRMEETLRERAELLELASEAIMVRNSAGAILFWNAGAEALYGWRREEVIGLSAHKLLATRFPLSEKIIAAAFAADGRWEGNLIQQNKDGKEIVVASRQALKQNSDFVLEINRDITAQLIAEEALRRNDRFAAMGKVAGIVAHEINNPLEAITNAFYLLRTHPSLDEEAHHYAALADQELARVSHITKQTLSFYREAQQAMRVSVCELLDDVLALQQRSLQINQVLLEKQYTTRGYVQGFPSELKQVFMNLVSNSIQAMPNGGRLRVTVNCVQRNEGRSAVRIQISDTGSGIRVEDAKHLFEPFFTTKSTKGTGLGLWISRGIVQKHDGALRFRSIFQTTNAATCFEVFLPIADGFSDQTTS